MDKKDKKEKFLREQQANLRDRLLGKRIENNQPQSQGNDSLRISVSSSPIKSERLSESPSSLKKKSLKELKTEYLQEQQLTLKKPKQKKSGFSFFR